MCDTNKNLQDTAPIAEQFTLKATRSTSNIDVQAPIPTMKSITQPSTNQSNTNSERTD